MILLGHRTRSDRSWRLNSTGQLPTNSRRLRPADDRFPHAGLVENIHLRHANVGLNHNVLEIFDNLGDTETLEDDKSTDRRSITVFKNEGRREAVRCRQERMTFLNRRVV